LNEGETEETRVYKCGSPEEFNLTIKSDFVDNDELIFYNIIGFENFFKAFLLIFQAITLEGWTLMMYNYSDTDSPITTILFFLFLVIAGAMTALNLVLAEIMNSFNT